MVSLVTHKPARVAFMPVAVPQPPPRDLPPLERMTQLVPEEKRHLVNSLLPRREPFQVLYRINCDNLCSDFQVTGFPEWRRGSL